MSAKPLSMSKKGGAGAGSTWHPPAPARRLGPARDLGDPRGAGPGLQSPRGTPHLHHDFAALQVTAVEGAPRIQAKLEVGPAGDRYEQEADRIADEVMRMPVPGPERDLSRSQQRRIAPRMHIEPRRAEPGGASTSRPELEARIGALSAEGQALDTTTRGFMEERLGYSLANVRVHSGTRAAEAAEAAGARAFAMGNHLVFGANEYQPESAHGRWLMAHELAHVAQQGQCPPATSLATHAAVPSLAQASGFMQAKPLTGEEQKNVQSFNTVIRMVSVLSPGLHLLIMALDVLGFSVTGLCIGIRASGTVHAGSGVGVGVDKLYFVDVATLELTTDAIYWGEVGAGFGAEPLGVGFVLGLRASPKGEAGKPSESYAGPSLNASLAALAHVGFSISAPLFRGEEGWISMVLQAVAGAGAEASISWGITSQELEALMLLVQRLLVRLGDAAMKLLLGRGP